MCRPGWARMCPQWGGRTHAEKLPARWEPLGRACLPLGRRVHYINLLKYEGIAGIFQRLHHCMLAPTQADAALISKWARCYVEVFF